LYKTAGVFFSLGEDKRHFLEYPSSNGFDFSVTIAASPGYSGVDYHHGDIQAAGGFNKVGPDFQFHQQAYSRANLTKGPTDYPRKIERKIKDAVLGSIKSGCPRKARVGRGADNNFVLRESLF